MNAARTQISVVTPVRDDPRLVNALCSVPADVELVVAMTRPSERTRRVACRFEKNRPNVKVCETNEVGMAAGVNLGVRAASHEKMVILDSDCTLTARTLEVYAAALNEAEFVRGKTFVRRSGGWSRFAGLGQEELNLVFARCARLIGPSIAFRKSAFLGLGGYDERSGASCDHEFVLRMEERGIRTHFAPEAVVWHQPITFKIDCCSHIGYGRSMRYIDVKRGSLYGLRVCLLRWYPQTLALKLVRRGPLSVIRSILMGAAMLYGYGNEIVAKKLEFSSSEVARDI